MPERIQLRRAKGWRMPAGAVKVDRTTRWGNPFDLRRATHCWTAIAYGFKGDRLGRQAASVEIFRRWILNGEAVDLGGCGLIIEAQGQTHQIECARAPDLAAPQPPSLGEIREHLTGKDLACWCKPGEPCHADVLLELANRET